MGRPLLLRRQCHVLMRTHTLVGGHAPPGELGVLGFLRSFLMLFYHKVKEED